MANLLKWAGNAAKGAVQAESNLVNGVGNAVGGYVNKNVIAPTVNNVTQGASALSQIQNNSVAGRGALTNVNVPRLASNFGQTVVNLAGLIPGEGAAVEGASVLGRLSTQAAKGALINGGYGAASGGLQAFGEGKNPAGIAKQALLGGSEGAVLGGALGGAGSLLAHQAAPAVKDAARAAVDNYKSSVLGGEGGYIGQPRDLLGKFGNGEEPKVAPVDLADPISVSKRIIDLHQQLADGNARFNQAREQILSAPNGDKKGALEDLQATHGSVLTAKQTELNQLQQLSKSVGAQGKALTSRTVPKPPPALAAPSLPQRLFQNAKSVLGSERGSIDLNAPLSGEEPSSFTKVGDALPTASKVMPPKMAEATTPKIVENTLTKRGKAGDQGLSPEVASLISGQHAVRPTEATFEKIGHDVNAMPLDAAIQTAHDILSVPEGTITDAQGMFAQHAFERAQAEGRTHDAVAIHDTLSGHKTAQGQSIQATKLFYKLSPSGMLYKALNDLKKGGAEITPELNDKLKGMTDKIKGLEKGKERDLAVAEFRKEVASSLPQSTADNLISVWKAGLLSGSKTASGNLVSNGTFGALKQASTLPAVAADRTMSLITGKRSLTATGKGIASGTAEGVKSGVQTLKTGLDIRNIGDKYEQHTEINFKNPVLQNVLGKPSNFVFRSMQAADQPFYYAALKNSLYDQAKADGINLGLKGGALTKHMQELAANPTDTMANAAAREADKAVLGYDTVASKMINGAHQAIENAKFPPAVKKVGNGILSVIAPFTKVPSAFLSRTVDFTPLGVGKEVFMQVAKKEFDQRALSQAIGEGATGTGIIALGVALAHSGQISGNYPKNDPKQAQRWKAEGIQPNSIKLGGKWYSLNYAGPLGLLLNAGNQYEQAKQKNTSNPLTSAAGGLAQGLMGQSFLQGFSGISDAVNNPEQNAKSYLNSQISSVIPSWSNDLANLTDSNRRQTNTPLDAAKNRIPGARQTLPVAVDALGNDLKQPAGGFNAAYNPLKPSNNIDSPTYSELNRLAATDKQNEVFPVPAKTIGSGATLTKLTPAQQTQRQQMIGQEVQPLWNSIISSPGYSALDDAHKAAALQSALTDVQSATDRVLANQINPAINATQATGNVARILSGNAPTASDYLVKQSNAALGKSTDPAQQYQVDLAKFKNNVSAGKLTPVQQYTQQQSLNKEAVTSKFSSDVQQFYGLSKAQQAAYVANNPEDGTKLYTQAKQLDSQLVAKGLATTKYKYGLSSASSSSSKKVPKLNVVSSSIKANKLLSGTKGTSFKTPKISVPKAKKTTKTTKIAKASVPKLPKTASIKPVKTTVVKAGKKAPLSYA